MACIGKNLPAAHETLDSWGLTVLLNGVCVCGGT